LKHVKKNAAYTAQDIPSRRALQAASETQFHARQVKHAQKLDKRYISVTAENGAQQIRTGSSKWKDTYHVLIETSWTQFVLLMLLCFLVLNLFFGVLYFIGPENGIGNINKNSFAEHFFFSVQTFATLGYGFWYPISAYANVIMTLESFAQVILIALATGLVFSKFSIPSANVLFCNQVVIGTVNGGKALRLRLANARGNQIVEAKVTVTLVMNEISAEGEFMRRLIDLELDRSSSPLFALSWLITHKIDENSVLFGMSNDDMHSKEVHLIVSLIGIDGTSSQTIHSRHFYTTNQIICNARFVDILKEGETGRRFLDFKNFHSIEMV
jgi:inward rectifier potassium channel